MIPRYRKYLFLAGLIICVNLNLKAQDSVRVDERAFLNIVVENAPYLKAKLLYDDIASQKVAESRGAFEPKLGSSYVRKQFDGKLYYSRSYADLTVQSPYALKWSGGYASSSGINLNPEFILPEQGLSYLSFELPLGAGLLTDKSRTQLKLARLNLSVAQLQVLLDVNDYLYKAGKAYWKWYEGIMMQNLAAEAQEVTRERLNFVSAKVRSEEYAAIDSLEAYINFQNRITFFQEQRILYQQSVQNLASLIGLQEGLQMAPVVDLQYAKPNFDSLNAKGWIQSHPVSQLFKIGQLSNETKGKLAKEYFKPQLDVKYSIQQNVVDPFVVSYRPEDNQYWGLSMEFPLFLRSERARVKEFELKNEVLSFEQQNFNVELVNSLNANQNILTLLDSNQQEWRSTAENYEKLLKAEQMRFYLGESNNFLVNRRESQWLETRKKYIKSYVEYRIRILEYYYLLALLPEVVGVTM